MLHFKPSMGRIGDPIPFFWGGKYHLFDQIGPPEPQRTGGHIWGHVVSRDLLHWEELPVAVPLGGPCAVDEHECGTGSVVERDGRFYLFYTGRRWDDWNRRLDTVCLSESDDMIHWKKYEGNPVSVPDLALYELYGWRDACVFWNEQAGCYWMVITAALRKGPWDRRGCLALATSQDLIHWKTEPRPFWQPNLTTRPIECPDVFRWNDWWYLVFFANGGTRYRMAKKVTGPWLKPVYDSFGGNYIAGGKTVSDGSRRWLFAFLKAHQDERDSGIPTARDVMALPREIKQNPDGTLRVVGPPDLSSLYGKPVHPIFKGLLGDWTDRDGQISGSRQEGLAYAVADVPTEKCVIDTTIRIGERGGHVGIAVHTECDLRPGYVLWLMPEIKEMRWTKLPGWYGDGYYESQPFIWQPGESITLQIVVGETTIEVFINNQTAISGRMYDRKEGKLALLVQEGSAVFESITVRDLNL